MMMIDLVKTAIIIIKLIGIVAAKELYTSVEELSKHGQIGQKVLHIINATIEMEQVRLSKLLNAQQLLSAAYQVETTLDHDMMNPIKAFLKVHKLVMQMEQLNLILDDQLKHKLGSEYEKLLFNLPDSNDLIGVGEALLRLQVFYDLKTDNLIRGNFNQSASESGFPLMNYEHAFELGKIAYLSEQYKLSIDWFKAAFKLVETNQSSFKDLETFSSTICEILDYMAFSSFKDGQIDQAAKLTRFWLQIEPNNGRAIENLEYYERVLSKEESFDNETEPGAIEQKFSYENLYNSGERFSPNGYEITHDRIVRNLCQNNYALSNNEQFCYYQNSHIVRYKIESLNSNPKIIRIYDIITKEEASHLKSLASTRLLRSTVQSKSGLVTTGFRLAKTAWLAVRADQTVERIDDRVAEVLRLDLDGSEDLQVVNYGLGGFYGPHLDSAKQTAKEYDFVPLSSLMENDRLATVLIYLNNVEAGGATVFPRLNLTVEPIERSAVVWFNLRKNGLTDERTLHTGCPVLVGSKWIATKWPREKQNMFLRKCGLNFDD